MALEDDIDISRGEMLVKSDNLREQSQEITAMISWFNERPLQLRGKYSLRHTTNDVKCIIQSVNYKMDINSLEKNIEDFATNTTRFFILSKKQGNPGKKNKTSIVFSIRHEPGELLRCLEEFATRNINLTKIESRPEKERPWHYVFYLDFEGYVEDPLVEKALVNLLKRAIFVKVLGSYPVGRTA